MVSSTQRIKLQVPNVSTLNVAKFPRLKGREKSKAPVRDLSKRPPVRTTSNIKIPGQGNYTSTKDEI